MSNISYSFLLFCLAPHFEPKKTWTSDDGDPGKCKKSTNFYDSKHLRVFLTFVKCKIFKNILRQPVHCLL